VRENETPARFEVGRSYSARSAADHETVFVWAVTARTAKFITVEDDSGVTKRVGVKTHDGVEWAMPAGRYSMAPVIKADRPDPPPYVTVMDAAPRSGWKVAHRTGCVITHTRLNAGKYDANAARAEAEAMFPNHLVVMPGDPVKPWKEAA
jgi:hypothetical protein